MKLTGKYKELIGVPYIRVKTILYSFHILSTKGLCLPDFIGIGAQKSGTTWLYENLCNHPELFLPNQKELHYFDWYVHKPLSYYSSFFTIGCQNSKIKGEITPGYSILSHERIRFIHQIIPDAKLIFLLRNPIERAWSQALMNLVSIPKRRYKEVKECEFINHFISSRSLMRGDYINILNRWTNVFPEEQLYIGFFDEIYKSPIKVLKDIFHHIGVTCDLEWSSFPHNRIVNKGPEFIIPMKFQNFLLDIYREEIENLAKRFGEPVSNWLS